MIQLWHVHLYFDPADQPLAETVAQAAARRFDVALGRFHPRPVGPHPTGSVQLTVPDAAIGPALGWFALHRQGLTVMIHPETGEDLVDHRDRVVWMGTPRQLDLSIFA